MSVALVLLGIVGVILIFACCKVSGDCSRMEEEEERKRMKDG